ncbi:unnamed protein product [Closterium sp. Naga37s-1]|nr:unnamed protein product [Closterium sp. Naga37s-1]
MQVCTPRVILHPQPLVHTFVPFPLSPPPSPPCPPFTPALSAPSFATQVCEDRVPADRMVLRKLAQDMRDWPRLRVSGVPSHLSPPRFSPNPLSHPSPTTFSLAPLTIPSSVSNTTLHHLLLTSPLFTPLCQEEPGVEEEAEGPGGQRKSRYAQITDVGL